VIGRDGAVAAAIDATRPTISDERSPVVAHRLRPCLPPATCYFPPMALKKWFKFAAIGAVIAAIVSRRKRETEQGTSTEGTIQT